MCKKGDYFGERALLKKQKRNATITAVSNDVVCLICNGDVFHSVIKKEFDKRRQGIMVRADRKSGVDPAKKKKTEKQAKWLMHQISRNQLCKDLGLDTKAEIVKHMYKETVAKGTNLIQEGDRHADKFHIVEQGLFDVYQKEKGKINQVKPGAGMGEIALLYDIQRTATCKAASECIVWTLTRNRYRTAITTIQQKQNKSNRDFLEKLRFCKHLKPQE
eukprot:UN33370